ncbi:MAG: hypothetical protein KKC19_04035, partial [Nanoarchaeota archaeon]|nr:hypothetical protein [Nanoarchaeota archaeon]
MERSHKFIGLFIALAVFSFVLIFSPMFHTGFYIYEESEYNNLNQTWDFSNLGDYYYNSSELSVTEEGVSLNQIIIFSNWTEENALDIDLISAFYDYKDKTNKLISAGHGNLKPDSKKILDITFDNDLDNGDVISTYALSGNSLEIYLCPQDIQCDSSIYGDTFYDGEEGFYNITISGLSSPTDSFSLVAPHVKIDYIQAKSVNITDHSFVNITYPSSAIIETMDVTGIKSITSLEFSDSLNNQSINYSYSSDSGITWKNIPDNLSELNISKIRFSATLISDTLGTPLLKNILLVYDKMPEEISQNNIVSYTVNLTSNEPTTINNSNIFLDVTILENVSNANITIEEIEDIPLESKRQLRSLINLNVDDNTRELLNSTKLKMYYTDEDISLGNLDESTLKFYYYNESSLIWEEIDSTINVDSNYIEVILPHLSIYGVFGEEVVVATPSSGSSSGNSGWVARRSGKIVASAAVKEEVEDMQQPSSNIPLEE